MNGEAQQHQHRQQQQQQQQQQNNSNLPIHLEQNNFRLEVAVDDVLAMQMLKYCTQHSIVTPL
jgi:hypothetical protein